MKLLGVLPAIAWFIVQLLSTGIFLPATALADTEGSASTVVICTPSGLKVIAFEGEPAGSVDIDSQHCDWCQTFCKTAPLDRSNYASSITFDFEKYVYAPNDGQRFYGQLSSQTASIRAPPL